LIAIATSFQWYPLYDDPSCGITLMYIVSYYSVFITQHRNLLCGNTV